MQSLAPIGTYKQVLAFISDDQDMLHEEDIQKNPFSLKRWIRYLDYKKNSTAELSSDNMSGKLLPLIALFERALLELPGSYKLWKGYLDLVSNSTTFFPLPAIYGIWERALLTQNRAPRIWIDYLEFRLQFPILLRSASGTLGFLSVFDRALRALPLSQHHRIWPLGLIFARTPVESSIENRIFALGAASIFARYSRIDPGIIDEMIQFMEKESFTEAAIRTIITYRLDPNIDMDIQVRQSYLHRLIELASTQSHFVHSQLELIVLSSVAEDGPLGDEAGWALISLASHSLLIKDEDGARALLFAALGIGTASLGLPVPRIRSARDFGLVFDSLAKIEEMAIEAILRRLNKIRRRGDHNYEAKLALEVDWRLARFEYLMKARERLLVNALLEASPYDPELWLRLAELTDHGKNSVFETAIARLNPKQRPGLADIWLAWAKSIGDSIDRSSIFDKALSMTTDDTEAAKLWLAFSADAPTPETQDQRLQCATTTLPKQLSLWQALLDRETSRSSPFPARIYAIFERVIDLRIATPSFVMSFLHLYDKLKGFQNGSAAHKFNNTSNLTCVNEHDERLFSACERSIAAFGFPAALDFWSFYLAHFEAVLEEVGRPWRLVERGRSLYEQALRGEPGAFSLWIAYASFEERYGQPRMALTILRRALAIEDKKTELSSASTLSRIDVWMVFLAKTRQIQGIVSMRQAFDDAIKDVYLTDSSIRSLALSYASLEESLGEIERARVIYAYGAKITDTRIYPSYWESWENFERSFGTPDTYRELLRIKRAVQAQFAATEVQFVPAPIQ